MMGFNDLGALGTSSFATTEDGNPDCSRAAEEAKKGEQDEASDDTDYNASNCTAR